MMKFLFLLPLIFLYACNTVHTDEKLDPQVIYKMDMDLTVNGKQTKGIAVAPKADSYTIGVKSAGKLNLFTLTNCHREMAQQLDSNEGTFVFTPLKDSPEQGICPINLGGYEKDRGRHAWAFIDFENPEYTMPAFIKCNGSAFTGYGVSACQSLVGLVQSIEFGVEVLISPDPGCPMPAGKDNKIFQFPIVKGKCAYLFLETAKGADRKHRLTTIGYEKILYRDK